MKKVIHKIVTIYKIYRTKLNINSVARKDLKKWKRRKEK